MKVVIIIPTYNERENIHPLVMSLRKISCKSEHDIHVLIVDDNSPDGTADVVRLLQEQYPQVHLLTGKKLGLGHAYIRGMAHAMEHLGAEVVFEMDADFSHNPSDIPRLLVNIEHGADFVIGSRYVPGGSIPPEWGVMRRANSLVGNIVARYVAGLYRVRDCTAGFRAIRTSILREIDLNTIRAQGYAFQVALLHGAVMLGAKVVEVPVDFVDRTRGTSKLGLRDILEFVVNACWIRFQSSKTFFKFALVGGFGVIINLGVFTILIDLGLNQYLASPIAIEVSIISNFLLNNYWTFARRATADRTRIKGMKFNAVSLVALASSYSTFIALSLVFPNLAPQVYQLIGVLPAILINYFLNSYWTFRHVERT